MQESAILCLSKHTRKCRICKQGGWVEWADAIDGPLFDLVAADRLADARERVRGALGLKGVAS